MKKIHSIFKSTKAFVLIVFSLMLFSKSTVAQPDTWQYNPSAYEYSMIVTASFYYNEAISRNPDDFVAAFINGNVQGVGKLEYIETVDQFVAFLLIKNNVVQGDTIQFQIFDGNNNQIIEAANTLVFESNQVLGTAAEPFFIADIATPLDVNLSSNEITENKAIGSLVGTFEVFDLVGDFHRVQLIGGDGSDDNFLFQVVDNELRTNAVLSVSVKEVLSIRVEVRNEFEEDIQKTFQIRVLRSDGTGSEALISNVTLSNNTISENRLAGTVVGKLVPEGNLLNGDAFSFSFVDGEGDTDNDLFDIAGDEIRSKNIFDFENKSEYNIRILTATTFGGSLERQFTVRIVNENEPPILINSIFSIEENTPVDTRIGQIEASDPEGTNIDFTLTNVVNGAPLRVSRSNGEIFVNDPNWFDFEDRQEIPFEITVTDESGLSITRELAVKLEDIIEQFLPANNIVTPNGDGFNDTWEVRSIASYVGYKLTIYNAAGREVFKTANYLNDWDATSNGKPLPSGVFYYVFINPNENKSFKGAISVIR